MWWSAERRAILGKSELPSLGRLVDEGEGGTAGVNGAVAPLSASASDENVGADVETFGADASSCRFRHAVPASALLPAEPARGVGVRHRRELDALVGSGGVGSDDLGGEGDAAVADGDAGAGDDLPGLRLVEAAEAARHAGPGLLHGDLPRGRFDDLVDALMAEPERLRELAERTPGGMEPADRLLIAEPRPIDLVLERNHAVTVPPGLEQQAFV